MARGGASEGGREVSRLQASLCLCVALLAAASGYAQLRSSAASVTLIAQVQESFSLHSVEIPLAQPLAGGEPSTPRVVQTLLGWQLRPGRTFQLTYHLENATGPADSPSYFGTVILSRVTPLPPILSFLPSAPPAGVIAGWGNAETAPTGVAGFALVVPPVSPLEAPVLRIRAIIF